MPHYDSQRGYELAGFVWFQGFNDMVDSWTYHKQMPPGGYDFYGDLLAHFIRDVRIGQAFAETQLIVRQPESAARP